MSILNVWPHFSDSMYVVAILTGQLSTNVATPKILGDSYEVGFSYRFGFGLVYMVVSQNRGTPT